MRPAVAARAAVSARAGQKAAPDAARGPAAEAAPWWLAPSPDTADGLSQAEAEARLARLGPNRLRDPEPPGALRQLLARLRNPLVLVLLAASTVSALGGDLANAAIVLGLVLASVLFDFVQEHRADRAVRALRERLALQARVRRDGRLVQLPVARLVPGDRVQLAAGDRVPADGFVVEARDCFVDQALLTGESCPVEKRPGAGATDASDLQQARHALFAGSNLLTGSATLLVVATGMGTALGQVAQDLRSPVPPTAFEAGMNRFASMLARLTLLLVLAVLLVNLLLHRPPLQSFLFAVALAVGMTPELLPMVVTVTLAHGARRMARRRVIVKRLASIQNLGAMDVLCTDKTGTLTEARIRLERCVDGEGEASARVERLAFLNSLFETGIRSPLDEALLAACPKAEADDCAGRWRKLDEVPFDFERRRVSVLLEGEGARRLIVKGAPDDVLALCARYERSAGQAVLDDAARERLRATCAALERQGSRVIAVASREVPPGHDHADVRDERELDFAGFAAFADPPKAGAREALHALAASGVRVKIVSGDSELVAQHLCGQLGLRVEGVLTGRDIAGMTDAALAARAGRTTLFCRVNPTQKSRVIRALQARGHVVGYLGDGVNDAPPLRAADVSLSVDGAVDVAREVADVVMLEHDLRVVHDGVVEGRRTFDNVMKYLMMGTSSNFGNMLSMAGASLLLPFLPMLPAQILLNNILYDLSEAAIPFDRVEPRALRAPRGWDLRFIRRYMVLFGLLSCAFDALTFWVLLGPLAAGEGLFRSGWFVESLVTQVLVVFVIRTRGRPWQQRPSPALAAASLAVAVAGLALPFTPLAGWFDLEPLPLRFIAWLIALVGGYLVLAEVAKRFFWRRLARHGRVRHEATGHA